MHDIWTLIWECTLSHAYQEQRSKQFAFTRFAVISEGYVNSSNLHHNIIRNDLNHLDIPQTVTLVHYINAIMLIVLDEQEVVSILDTLVRHMYYKKKINLMRI